MGLFMEIRLSEEGDVSAVEWEVPREMWLGGVPLEYPTSQLKPMQIVFLLFQ